jgi:hypothetical protein
MCAPEQRPILDLGRCLKPAAGPIPRDSKVMVLMNSLDAAKACTSCKKVVILVHFYIFVVSQNFRRNVLLKNSKEWRKYVIFENINKITQKNTKTECFLQLQGPL